MVLLHYDPAPTACPGQSQPTGGDCHRFRNAREVNRERRNGSTWLLWNHQPVRHWPGRSVSIRLHATPRRSVRRRRGNGALAAQSYPASAPAELTDVIEQHGDLIGHEERQRVKRRRVFRFVLRDCLGDARGERNTLRGQHYDHANRRADDDIAGKVKACKCAANRQSVMPR